MYEPVIDTQGQKLQHDPNHSYSMLCPSQTQHRRSHFHQENPYAKSTLKKKKEEKFGFHVSRERNSVTV